MENLSDEEFGTKSTEEAPILIAQRYLNIFRQVHIFNKATRDKFDDELLALPDNVINFIKKMPGGRLLIEHLEEIKTNRGISFVKTNRDEFSNTASSSAGSGGAVVPMQGGGGNVVMDASFAETLARSLAGAFQNASGGFSGGTPFAASADMGHAFELIAEEIRASHSSLLDVLKETRNITDSVIASQVSVSRILEGLLSSRSSESGNGNNELNSQIIASQASITKLLENLYQSNTQRTTQANAYFDIENRLSQFEREIKNEIKSMLENRIASPINSKPADNNFSKSTAQNFVESGFTDNNEFRHNKKKKNKNRTFSSAAPFAATPVSATDTDAISHVLNNIDNVDTESDLGSSFGGVIRNSAYKYEDDFDNVNLNKPPLENVSSNLYSKESEPTSNDILADLDNLEDLNLSSKPVSSKPVSENNFTESSAIDEDLNLADLPQHGNVTTESSDLNLDSLVQNHEDILSGDSEDTSDLSLDNLATTDDLDINLSDEDTAQTISDTEISHDDIATDSSLALDNLDNLDDFQTNTVEDNSSQNTEDEKIAFDEPVLDTENSDADAIATDSLALDNLDNLDDFQTNAVEDNSIQNIEDEETTFDEPVLDTENSNAEDINLDDFSATDNESSEDSDAVETTTTHPSLFNATLDKIRDALTSDHIDLSSLDEPIALDDYSDDENVSEDDSAPVRKDTSSASAADDDEWEYEYVEDDDNSDTENADDEENWEYEYVDENGNIVTAKDKAQEGEDWEWEYVDDESSDTSNDENKPQ